MSEEYTSAVQIAESLLAGVGVESVLDEGEQNGTEYEKYHWTITSYPYDIYAQHNLEAVKKSPFKKLRETMIFQVVVKVAWGDDDNQRFVELNTLKYGSNKS